MSVSVPAVSVVDTVHRTRLASRATLRRRDSLLVFGAITVGYLLAYLFAIGHLGGGDGSVGVLVVDAPLARSFQSVGAFTFEAVARVDLGPVSLLVSPLNVLIGTLLSALVGLNMSLSYLAWRQPKACGIAARSGSLAALPALFSGAACCGPTLLIVLGIQASGLLLTAFDFLVPLGTLLLVASLLWIGRRVDPGWALERTA